jgi:hypothetical protein
VAIEWLGGKFESYIDKLIEQRAHRAGAEMVKVAKMLVPVDTGLLKSRIYYSYQPATRMLTLHADTHYALYVETGTYRMRPRPYLRPALLAVGMTWLVGIKTGIQVESSLKITHVPRFIQAHIRPHIDAANMQWNRGRVAKSPLNVVHVGRSKTRLQRMSGRTDLSRLNKIKRAWN